MDKVIPLFSTPLQQTKLSVSQSVLQFIKSQKFHFHGNGYTQTSYGSFEGHNISSGSGDDTIIGGNNTNNTEDDYRQNLFGGDGHDSIDGKGGSDYLYGESGRDTLIGGDGDEAQEGRDAFKEKRKPNFKKYPKLP